MNTVLGKILDFLKSIIKDVIYIVIILLLIGALSISINKCSNVRHEYENNIIALNDTIHYYQGKNGNLVATIRAFESDVNTLELLNKELYNRIDDLKAKGNVTNGTYFSGVIEHEHHDTTWVVTHDTITRGFIKDFEFNNEFRLLEGNVSYKDDTVGININKDQVMFDYIVAMDDKNNIMIQSSNPYVKFDEITGFQLPKPRKKHWSLGPSINYGYDPFNKRGALSIGVSLNYGIIQW